MAVEEIVLSLPDSVPREEPAAAAQPGRSIAAEDRLVRRFRQILKERERFAWTRRARARRLEVFDVACRSLVKQLAQQSTAGIGHRDQRLRARTYVYAYVVGLLNAASEIRFHREARTRRLFLCGLALSAVGVSSLIGAALLVASTA